MSKKQYKVKYNRHEYRQEYLRSDEWKKLRQQVIDLDCNCVCCDENADDVHHLIYRNIVDVKVTDLIPVCRECHNFIHKAIDDKYIPKEGDVDEIRELTIDIMNDEDYKEYAKWLRTKHHLPEKLTRKIKSFKDTNVMRAINGMVKATLWYEDLQTIKLTGRQIEKLEKMVNSKLYRRTKKIGEFVKGYENRKNFSKDIRNFPKDVKRNLRERRFKK